MQKQYTDSYSLIFDFFSRVLTVPPEATLLSEIIDNQLMRNWPIEPTHRHAKIGLNTLSDFFTNPDPGLHEVVQRDYFLLFEQSPARCRPWESVWRNNRRLLFDDETFQVRDWYARFGLRAPNYNREPDDHLGLELGFLAHLLNLASAATDQTEFHKIIADSTAFLQKHLMTWGTECLLEIGAKAETDFYKGIGLLAAGTLLDFNALMTAEN